MQAMQSCSVKPSNVFGGARCQNMPRRCIGNRLMVRAEKVLIINTKVCSAVDRQSVGVQSGLLGGGSMSRRLLLVI